MQLLHPAKGVFYRFSDDLGKLAENAVLVELKRREKEVYFWKEQKEADFVIGDKDSLTAINVTYTDKILKREKEGLLKFKGRYNESRLIIITKDFEENDGRINYIPLWEWLLNLDKF